MIQIQNPSGIHYTIMCVLIDVFVLLCSFVIICLLYIFVVVVFFFVADTLYRLEALPFVYAFHCGKFDNNNNNNNNSNLSHAQNIATESKTCV